MAHLTRLLALALALAIAAPSDAQQSGKAAPKSPAKKAPAVSKTASPIGVVAPKVDYVFSHALPEAAESELKALVQRFNDDNPATPIKLERLGENNPPALLNLLQRAQVAELVANKKGFRPLHLVMREGGQKFDAGSLSRDLRFGVTDDKGRYVALPVAYSTPVLFFNKNAFRKAKLDPEKPPETWLDVQQAAATLVAAGFACPYTTSSPAWIHIDNLTALSGAKLTNPKGELAFNGLPQVRHIARLATWKTSGYLHLFGRRDEADEQFKNGKCVMLTTDSAAHTEFREAQGVEVGVAPLPHPEDVWGGRQNTLAGGTALWIGAAKTPAEYKVAAKFIAFLLTPEMQVRLAGLYGHLPLTETAWMAMKSDSMRDRSRTLEVAQGSMKGRAAAMPLRVSAIDPVRQILEEELEKVWKEGAPPKLALDTAVTRGNAVLKAKPALRKPVPF